MLEFLKSLDLELINFPVGTASGVLTAFIVFVLVRRALERYLGGWYPKLIWVFEVIAIPALILVGVNVVKSTFSIPPESTLARQVDLFALSLVWFVGAWLLNRALEIFIWADTFKRLTHSDAPRLLRALSSALIYLLAVHGIITFVFERPSTGFLFSTGIIAGILGLALQNILSDLFSGLAITFDRPYRVGDWIQLEDGTLGQVVDITWRSTRLLSYNSSIYVVPNGVAARSVIHNFEMPNSAYSTRLNISIDAEVEPMFARQLLLKAVLNTPKILKHPPPVVRFSDMTTQPYKYVVWVHFENYNAQWAAREELFSNIWTEFNQVGIASAAVKFDIATRDAPIPNAQRPTILDELRGIEIFKILPEDDLQSLAEVCARKLYQSNQTIVSESDEDDALFIITSGMVLVQKSGDFGKSIELARLGAGQYFGEMALLNDQPRLATISTLTACELIEVPRSALEPILQINSSLAETLTTKMQERQAQTQAIMANARVSNDLFWLRLPRIRLRQG